VFEIYVKLTRPGHGYGLIKKMPQEQIVGAHCFLDSGEKVGNAVVVVVWTSWTLRVHDHFALHERSPN